MSMNSVHKAIVSGLLAAMLCSSALAQPVRHFNVEGTIRALNDGSGNTTTRSSIESALDGQAFSVSFDLDFSTPDSNPSADKGRFTNAVRDTSATSGAFSFSPISDFYPGTNPCFNLELNCFLETQNDQFGIGFDLYWLRTGYVESSSFNTLVSSTLPGAGTMIGGVPIATYVSMSFTLSAAGVGLFSSPSMQGPNELNIADLSTFSRGSGASASFFTHYGLGQGTESGWADFGLDITRIREAESYITPVSAVPEPETYAILLAGLGLMGAVARKRKLGKSA